jgi:CYTH domain-containing protein
MLIEIERKFLVKKELLPDLTDFKPYEIEQCFVNENFSDYIVRVRKDVHDGRTKYVLAIKGKGSIERLELEYKITEQEYNNTK